MARKLPDGRELEHDVLRKLGSEPLLQPEQEVDRHGRVHAETGELHLGTRVALVLNPETAPFSNLFWRPLEAAAPSFAITPISTGVRSTDELERMVDAFARVEWRSDRCYLTAIRPTIAV